MINEQGWLKLHRKVFSSQVFSDDGCWRMFTLCLLSAEHKGTYRHGIRIPAGAFVTTQQAVCNALGISRQAARERLAKLVEWGCVKVRTSNKFTIISLENWSEYQASNNQQEVGASKGVKGDFCDSTTNEQPTNNHQATNEQPSSNQRTTSPNINKKKVKNSKNRPASAGTSTPPTLYEAKVHAVRQGRSTWDGEQFWDFNEARGWRSGGKPVQDWHELYTRWVQRSEGFIA